MWGLFCARNLGLVVIVGAGSETTQVHMPWRAPHVRPTLNRIRTSGERESERSTVAKSQNAMHISPCDINQFLPARHNLPQGWLQIKTEEEKKYSTMLVCVQGLTNCNMVNILIRHEGNIREQHWSWNSSVPFNTTMILQKKKEAISSRVN